MNINLHFLILNLKYILSAYEKPNPISQDSPNLIDSDFLKISKRVCPEIFDEEALIVELDSAFSLTKERVRLNKFLDFDSLNIHRIPEQLIKEMRGVEKLKLSNNKNLKIDQNTFSSDFENLKELIFDQMVVDSETLKIISSCKSLERLSISNCKDIPINSVYFMSLLKKLKHFRLLNL